MDIIVHGTKGGYDTFTPKVMRGIFDARPDSSNVLAIGQQAYSLHFYGDNYIFSKYIIIRDVPGDKRTGNVAVSLVLPNNKKLSGAEIVLLIDSAFNEYCEKYIVGNNLDNVREDWAFLSLLIDEYQTKLFTIPVDDVEILKSGTKDAAFIYYKDDQELVRYFNVPFQEKYSVYNQIFFVKEELKDKPESPLNALRNSEDNLTGKIDLENPKFKLLFNQHAKDGVKINVKADGRACLNKDKVRRKSEMEITWSKKFYQTIVMRGKWSDIGDRYIKVDNSLETISINEIELAPVIKSITFEIRDFKDNIVSDAEIKIDKRPWQADKSVSFQGEEIGEKWSVSSRRGYNLVSEKREFVPEEIQQVVEIRIREFKKVEIIATDEIGIVRDFIVHIPECNIHKTSEVLEFIDDQIDQRYTIHVSKIEGGKNYVGSCEFCPRSGDKVYVELKPEETKFYNISAGEYGHKASNCPPVSKDANGEDIEMDAIIPERGYLFTGFKLETDITDGNADGTLVAQYKEEQTKWGEVTAFFSSSFRVAALIVGSLSVGLAILVFFSRDDADRSEQFKAWIVEVKGYVEGVELNINKLENYKKLGDTLRVEPKIIETSLWWNPITWLGNGEPIRDSTAYNQWVESLQLIERAIDKRNLINDLNFSKLKHQIFSEEQRSLELAIGRIDTTKYKKISEKLHVRNLNLNQIAEKIDSLLNANVANSSNTSAAEENEITDSIESKTNNINVDPSGEQKPSRKHKPTETSFDNKPDSSTPASDITSEIVLYIKGDELKKEVLNQYLIEVDKKNKSIRKSIQLCLDFWNLDGSGTGRNAKTYYTFREVVSNDVNLKNSALKDLLDELQTKDAPKYLKQIAGNSTIFTLKQFKNKVDK